MGLFDYVKCEIPLPDGSEATLFQTKDTEAQYMEVYRITAGGRLIHETVRYEIVPPEERQYPDPDDFRHFLGSLRSISTGDVDCNYHGVLRFYTDSGGWREYKAKFTDGNLVEITRVDDRAADAVGRAE